MQNDPNATVKGVTDLSKERAQALADEYGVQVYENLETLLADDEVDLIVNLTIHHAHFEVNKACLEAGKHVFSEKPLALEYQEAKTLVDLAGAKGLRLGSAPFTLLYETHQSAWRTVRSGELGRVRLAYAELNWGRMETWHPASAALLRGGTTARRRRLSTDLFNSAVRARSRGDGAWNNAQR